DGLRAGGLPPARHPGKDRLGLDEHRLCNDEELLQLREIDLRPAPALPDSEVREFALELRPKVAELRPELITANGVNPACGQDLLRLAGGDDVGPVLVVGVL